MDTAPTQLFIYNIGNKLDWIYTPTNLSVCKDSSTSGLGPREWLERNTTTFLEKEVRTDVFDVYSLVIILKQPPSQVVSLLSRHNMYRLVGPRYWRSASQFQT